MSINEVILELADVVAKEKQIIASMEGLKRALEATKAHKIELIGKVATYASIRDVIENNGSNADKQNGEEGNE